MKLQFILLSAFFLCLANHVFTQENIKLGHVNIPEIVQKMPETDSIRTIIEKETLEMEKMYEEMIAEHETNLKKFEAEQNSYTEFVRNAKESDIMEMAAKIQQFQQTANQQLQKRNMELFQPVYKRINDAIQQVAQKNNFTYILELSSGAVAYHAPTSENINPLVSETLKIAVK